MGKKDRKVQQQQLDELRGIREATERSAEGIGKLASGRWVGLIVSVVSVAVAVGGIYLDQTNPKRLEQTLAFTLTDVSTRLPDDTATRVDLPYWLKPLLDSLDARRLQRTVDLSVLLKLGNVERERGHLDKSVSYYNTVADLTEKANHLPSLSIALCNRGQVRELQGKYEEALADFDSALVLSRGANDSIGVANALKGIGFVQRSLGNADEAVRYATLALGWDRALDNTPGVAADLGNLGVALWAQKKYDSALVVGRQSLTLCKALGVSKMVANQYHNIAQSYWSRFVVDHGVSTSGSQDTNMDVDLALSYYDSALQISISDGDVWGESITRCGIGLVHLWFEEYDKARHQLSVSKEIMDKYGFVDEKGIVAWGLNQIDSAAMRR